MIYYLFNDFSRVSLHWKIVPFKYRECKYRGILADVIVYIFAHLHRALRTEGKM